MSKFIYSFCAELVKLAERSAPRARDYVRDYAGPLLGGGLAGLGAYHLTDGASAPKQLGVTGGAAAAGGILGNTYDMSFDRGYLDRSYDTPLTEAEAREVGQRRLDATSNSGIKRAISAGVTGVGGAALGGALGHWLSDGDLKTTLRSAGLGGATGAAVGDAAQSARNTRRSYEQGRDLAGRHEGDYLAEQLLSTTPTMQTPPLSAMKKTAGASSPSVEAHREDKAKPLAKALAGGATGGFLAHAANARNAAIVAEATRNGKQLAPTLANAEPPSLSDAHSVGLAAGVGAAALGAYGVNRAARNRFKRGYEAGSGAPLDSQSEETRARVNQAAKDSASGSAFRRTMGTLGGTIAGGALGAGIGYAATGGDTAAAITGGKAGVAIGSAGGYVRSAGKETRRQHRLGRRLAQKYQQSSPE